MLIILDRRLLSYQLALVVQLAFALMCAVTYMQFTCSAVFAEGYFFSLVVSPSFCTALLRVPAFRIWHINDFLNIPEFI